MHGLGSHMIQVQISRIIRSQLERASHLAAKNHMRNHDSARLVLWRIFPKAK